MGSHHHKPYLCGGEGFGDRSSQAVRHAQSAKVTATLVAHPAVVAFLPALKSFREDCIGTNYVPSCRRTSRRDLPPPVLRRGRRRPLRSNAPVAASPVSITFDDTTRSPIFAPKQTWAALAESLTPGATTQRRFGACLGVIKKLMAASDQFVVCAVASGSHVKGTDTDYGKDLDVVVKFEQFEPGRLSEYLEWILMLYARRLEITNTKPSLKAFQFELKGLPVDVLVSGDINKLEASCRATWPTCRTEIASAGALAVSSNLPPSYSQSRLATLVQGHRASPSTGATKRSRNGLTSAGLLHPLELLVFHSLNNDSSKPCTSIEAGFIGFLRCIVNFKDLYETWDDLKCYPLGYEVPDEVQIDEPPLNPTDPHDNVAKNVKHWEQLAEKANAMLRRLVGR